MSQNPVPKIDWGGLEIPSEFYGRDRELEDLQKRILSGYRVVALVGMRGIGKTSLAMKLADQIKDNFDYVIARTLKDTPPLQELLGSWLQFFSNQENEDIPKSIDSRINSVMKVLSNHRCLLLLDDVEEILQAGKLVGEYKDKFQDYENLFRRVEGSHKSCLLLLSCEKHKVIRTLEKNIHASKIHSLQLQGLDVGAVRKIFPPEIFSASESELTELINIYQGNPYYLYRVREYIQRLHGCNLADFLEIKTIVFQDIEDDLHLQLERCSRIENQIINLLDNDEKPRSIKELNNQINQINKDIPNAIDSLLYRFLIVEDFHNKGYFTLQNIVKQYVKSRRNR
ncbi:MAG: ATP-binding protein [Gloeotrichia echinulata DEX184]|nr:ATP-binding protein [Gloeotrichia echinulata DEX184]